MGKYTGKMIPFDIEKFNEGYEPVYRNGNPVKRIVLTPECLKKDEKILSIDHEGYLITHREDGLYDSDGDGELDIDLMLKAKEVTVWHNWYREGEIVWTVSYTSENSAKRESIKDFRYIGTFPATIQI